VNSGGASFHAPPPLAARGLTRRRWKLKKQGLWNVLFPGAWKDAPPLETKKTGALECSLPPLSS